MFNTVALTLRPDEVRLFIVLFRALLSAALAAVARWLLAILLLVPERGRPGVRRPLAQVFATTAAIGSGADPSTEPTAPTGGRLVDEAARGILPVLLSVPETMTPLSDEIAFSVRHNQRGI
jgi:hypothetical protein